MADGTEDRANNPIDNTNQPEKSGKIEISQKKKRQLKAAPVTVREQSEQAQAKSARPGIRGKAGRVASAPIRGIARIFRPLGKFKVFRLPFKFLGKFLGFIFAPPYLRNAFKELRMVTWPTGKQSRQLTFAVIIFSLIFGLIAAITDYGLDKLFRSVILKK